jgi:PhnB protein
MLRFCACSAGFRNPEPLVSELFEATPLEEHAMAGFPRPEGHHTLTPASIVPNAAQVISFMEKAFHGKLVDKYEGPGGIVAHAEVMVGDSVLMIGDPSNGVQPMPISISYYVDPKEETVDDAYQRALAAGGTSIDPPQDQFYGYRSATVRDPGGNRWSISAVVEQLTSEEAHRRMPDLNNVS